MEKKCFFQIDFLQTKLGTFLAFIFLFTSVFFADAQTYNTPGATTWTCPAGVTSVTVECWGAGGGGQRANDNPSRGGGGSGGGYVKTIYSVTPGNTYNLFVGTGGSGNPGNDGTASWFINSSTILAIGGKGAGPALTNTNGTGASAYTSGNIGGALISNYGGNGGNGRNNGGGRSGGGGSSAGSSPSGNANFENGGAAPTDGYSGANGITSGNNDGLDGGIGAGGSGGRANSNTDRLGGSGGNGQVRIRFSTISSFTPIVACSNSGTTVTITGTNLNGTTAVTFNGTAATFTVISNTQITAVVPNGASTGLISITTPFGSAFSATNLTITPPSIGGTITGGNTPICLGTSTGLMTLSGHAGTIINWEYRVNGGGWTNSGINTPTYSMTPWGSGTWDYRVLVQNGSCPSTYSSIRTIIVDQTAVGGGVYGGTTPICLGQSTGTMTLGGGYVGNVVRWEKRLLPSPTWTNIANTIITYSETPSTAGTWEYRALVASGSCPQVYSSAFTVVVNPTLTLTLGPNPIVCQNTTTALLPFTATTGSPDAWVINFNAAAETAGFSDQNNSIGTAPGNISINVPWAAPIGVYSGTITVIKYSPNCTSISYPFTVSVGTIAATPTVPTTSATTICHGSTTTFTTSSLNAFSYNWTVSGAGNTISGTGTSATVTWSPSFSGNATISVSANGCNNTSGIASRVVFVNAAPTAPPTPLSNSPQCSTTGVTLIKNGSPIGGTNWYWQTSPTGTATGNFAPTWTVFTSGTYYIRTLNFSTGCWSPATSINVTISLPPSITLTSDPSTLNQNACLNNLINPIIFDINDATSASVSGLPLGINGSFNTGIFTISGAPSVTGTFPYTITTVGGCITNASTSGTITVNSNPIITSATSLCLGNTVSITPSSGGNWISNNPLVATITNSGIVTGVSAGTVTFTFTNSITGCSSTTNVMTINPLPAAPPVPLSNSPQCGPGGVTLTRNGNPIGGTNWYWQTSPTGTTTANFAPTWTVFTSGTYYIRTLNFSTGCWSTATSITIVANTLPSITLTSGAGTANQNACRTFPLTNITYAIGGSGASTSVVGLPPGITSTVTSGVLTISGTPTTNGTYNYTVTTTGICTPQATASGTIIVREPPVLSSPPVSICAGNTAPLTPNSGGTWISSNPTVATISNTGLITAVAPGTVNFTYTNTISGCSRTTANVTVNPRPIVTLGADYCAVGGFVQLIASSNTPGTTWLWNTGQTTSSILVDIAGNYTVTGTAPNGCSSSFSIPVAQELVVNGNFTDGNIGFNTDYVYYPDLPVVQNELHPEASYGVHTNANEMHNNFWGIDHTNNSVGPRNMMIINGSLGIDIWSQTVDVKPNSDYYFSAWAMSVNPSNPAQLRFEVNGVPVGTTAFLGASPTNAAQAAANNYWQRFHSGASPWNSGALSGPITIRIINLVAAAGGNDFAIDDISFGTLSTFVNLTSTPTTNTQSVCNNTPIDDITYSIGSGIAGPTITGLPPGVTSSWNGVTLRISGTPTTAGLYTYTVTTTGNCLPATATGTIFVKQRPNIPISLAVTQPNCLISTGSISVSSANGHFYDIDGVNSFNTSGVFSGLAPGTYTITTRNSIISDCPSLSLTVVILPENINTWNGTNWSNGTPIITDTVIFNGNYNQSGDFQGCSCNVISGNVIIPSDNTITIANSVRVIGGSLTFENNSSLVQINNATNIGNITYKRSAASIQGQDYIYWSSPVTNQNLNTIYTTPAQGQKYIWNTTTNNGNGTGGNISQGNWEPVDNVIMQAARGYIVRGSNNFSMPATTINSSFIGVPRNGNITTSIARGQYTGANYIGLNGISITNLDDNWNLIGNPYPSSINALQFLSDNSGVILGNVRLWKHGIDISNATSNPYYGSYTYNYSSSDYEIINFTGTTTPGFNEIIKTGQAFFVQMIDGPGNSTSTVSFNNGQRSSNYANNNFFRVSAENSNEFNTTSSPERHRIWLDIINSSNASAGTLVGYVEGASMGADTNFDAYDTAVGDMRIFSSIGDNVYAIQGRSLPFNQDDLVPLVAVTPSAGVYTIAIREVDGLFENSAQNIYLEDTMLGTIHDLKLNPYTFTSTPGTHYNRFVLRYTNATLNLPTFETNDNVFAYTNDNVWVKSIDNNIKDIVVYDLLGKKVDEYSNVNTNEIKLKNLMPRKMVYILRITLENNVIVNKKIIF